MKREQDGSSDQAERNERKNKEETRETWRNEAKKLQGI